MTSAVLVVAGGPTPPSSILERVPAHHAVVAADSGVDNALALGIEPTLVVGDLDSMSPEGQQWLRSSGIDVQRYPTDKDFTDLELALDAAVGLGERVVLVDSGAGRVDHALANLFLLASDAYAEAELQAVLPTATVTVVRRHATLAGSEGDLVTLLPVAGPATGVTTAGLAWPLDGATIQPGSTHGVSNTFLSSGAAVSVDAGVLLAIQPDAE